MSERNGASLPNGIAGQPNGVAGLPNGVTPQSNGGATQPNGATPRPDGAAPQANGGPPQANSSAPQPAGGAPRAPPLPTQPAATASGQPLQTQHLPPTIMPISVADLTESERRLFNVFAQATNMQHRQHAERVVANHNTMVQAISGVNNQIVQSRQLETNHHNHEVSVVRAIDQNHVNHLQSINQSFQSLHLQDGVFQREIRDTLSALRADIGTLTYLYYREEQLRREHQAARPAPRDNGRVGGWMLFLVFILGLLVYPYFVALWALIQATYINGQGL
ncbi:hypothetical protein F4821DRAFT_263545 [Hypoxylon rubiginosum]|uniref:Uncharacterized protein n=1 Tax=Hypoxylon rubiginosum TaxID=110542 RepID=A0ACC0CRE9_9PEZI|nr:hypothetical protein F4821DRAFT_263545 [Hypoxylon rubiginosum]